LACIPPPSWTNALHRNGVKVLGTFLVEPQSRDICKILQRTGSAIRAWNYTLASQLTRIARFYGFDGWLINIEKTFPIVDWSLPNFEGFLKQLRSSFGDGCVIWYDSLTRDNRIDYQNALTERNIIFAKAAGSILTNYVWTPETATTTKALALQNDIDPADVLCGIDVWAQSSERETYPRDVGGGTGTGLAVAKLAELGLSAGIFGPAWPYEHFHCLSDSRAVEKAMWTAAALPETLRCDCASRSRHHIENYMEHPILANAQNFLAGSNAFFYTDFMQAFEVVPGSAATTEKTQTRANLVSLSVSPQTSVHPSTQKGIVSRVESSPSRLSIYLRAGWGRTRAENPESLQAQYTSVRRPCNMHHISQARNTHSFACVAPPRRLGRTDSHCRAAEDNHHRASSQRNRHSHWNIFAGRRILRDDQYKLFTRRRNYVDMCLPEQQGSQKLHDLGCDPGRYR